jgi:hypothetical protein
VYRWAPQVGTNLHLLLVLVMVLNIVLTMVLVVTPFAGARSHAVLAAALPHQRKLSPRTGGTPERLAQAAAASVSR